MRIMIVDDAPAIRERLRDELSLVDGVEVVAEAGNAVTALTLARQHRPDASIVDLSLPGGSGFEVLAGLKSIDPTSTAIVLTNYAEVQNRDACLRAGANYFFDKSHDIDRLMSLLNLLSNMKRVVERQ